MSGVHSHPTDKPRQTLINLLLIKLGYKQLPLQPCVIKITKGQLSHSKALCLLATADVRPQRSETEWTIAVLPFAASPASHGYLQNFPNYLHRSRLPALKSILL